MNKFGVDEQGAGLEKKAGEGCPICGVKPEKQGNLLFCKEHGSEPFEAEKKNK